MTRLHAHGDDPPHQWRRTASSNIHWRKAMYSHSRRLLLTASAIAAVVALPAAARAQMLDPIRVTDAVQKAEKLDAEALAVEQNDWSQLKKAARLREEAAQLRDADDPAGTVSLYWAARDRY